MERNQPEMYEFIHNYEDLGLYGKGQQKIIAFTAYFKPIRTRDFSFNIHSFGPNRIVNFETDHTTIADKRSSFSSFERESAEWFEVGGIDSFYSCDFDGYIVDPMEFENCSAVLKLNYLSSKDRLELNRRGSIGKGSYQGEFEFDIYVDLQTTKEFVSILQGKNQFLNSTEEHDKQVLRKIRLDLCRFEGQKSDRFEICRIYV